MAKYSYLRFFNGVENELNLDYDATNEKWNGVVYLPEVSVGLYETFNLFILEELVDSNGHIVYGRPISANSSGSNFSIDAPQLEDQTRSQAINSQDSNDNDNNDNNNSSDDISPNADVWTTNTNRSRDYKDKSNDSSSDEDLIPF